LAGYFPLLAVGIPGQFNLDDGKSVRLRRKVGSEVSINFHPIPPPNKERPSIGRIGRSMLRCMISTGIRTGIRKENGRLIIWFYGFIFLANKINGLSDFLT